MKQGWITMPSGRASAVWQNKFGYVGLSAWPNGRWRIRIRQEAGKNRVVIDGESIRADIATAMADCELRAAHMDALPINTRPAA